MSKPQSEAEYLARMIPPSVAALRRRTFLKVAGTGAAFALPSLLAACGGDEDGEGTAGGAEHRRAPSRSVPTRPAVTFHSSVARRW